MDQLLQQIVNIQKASAYDIVSKQCIELKSENESLKAEVKRLKELINEYSNKIINA